MNLGRGLIGTGVVEAVREETIRCVDGSNQNILHMCMKYQITKLT